MLMGLLDHVASIGALLLAAEPLGLVGDVAQPESTPWEMARWSVFTSGTAMTIVTVAIAVSALAASTSAAAIAWSRWRELELRPSSYATRVLAKRLGLSNRDRRTLEALARAHGEASPGALLLCPSAFEKAAGLVCGPGSDQTHVAAVESLRSRLSV
ncbi:MAG: hypothetical protein K2Y21_08525 [Phycisphaerales bacterium]|nr:hypothetical protein [Phycisphaerales bacterium]